MSVSLSNRASADGYTAANTLRCPGATKVNVQAFNAAIVVQFARAEAEGLDPVWGTAAEEDLYPNGGSFDRRCDGVRFRSKVAGRPAQVSIAAMRPEEA